VRVGVSGKMQVSSALAEVTQIMEGKTVHFNGAQDAKLPSVQASWDVDYFGDDAKRAMNSEVLDGVARILQRYPSVRMQVHGETGNADIAPELLAQHYGKHAKRDVQVLCDRLAENRAVNCMDALIARGVERSRLYTTYKSRTGSLKTEFIPHAPDTSVDTADFASGVIAALGEFTVQPEGQLLQQVSLVLAYATGELRVVLRSPQAGTSHWSGWLPMANGVPLYVRHVGLGLDVDLITAEVHDGEVVLSGADMLFVGQRYRVYAPDTLRSTAASAEVTIVYGQQVLELKMMRPARRIELALTTTTVTDLMEAAALSPREKVMAFMIDNDVLFNGAAESATQNSALGTPQAWNIDNLDYEKKSANGRTIAGIAHILLDHPEISCEVFGQTSKAEQAPLPLAEYHQLDPTAAATCKRSWIGWPSRAPTRASTRSSRRGCRRLVCGPGQRGARARSRSTSSRRHMGSTHTPSYPLACRSACYTAARSTKGRHCAMHWRK